MKTESFLFALNYSIQLIHKQPANIESGATTRQKPRWTPVGESTDSCCLLANRFAHDSAFGLPALRFVASLCFRQNGSLDKQGAVAV